MSDLTALEAVKVGSMFGPRRDQIVTGGLRMYEEVGDYPRYPGLKAARIPWHGLVFIM